MESPCARTLPVVAVLIARIFESVNPEMASGICICKRELEGGSFRRITDWDCPEHGMNLPAQPGPVVHPALLAGRPRAQRSKSMKMTHHTIKKTVLRLDGSEAKELLVDALKTSGKMPAAIDLDEVSLTMREYRDEATISWTIAQSEEDV